MGVDEAVPGGVYEQVMLAGAGPAKRDIAGQGRPVCHTQSGLACERQPAGNRKIAQGVSLRRRHGEAGPAQALGNQSHAVETGGLIPSAEPEGRTDEPICSLGQSQAGRRVSDHPLAGGRRTSWSLPGRKGSPRKFTALSNRVAHVASV